MTANDIFIPLLLPLGVIFACINGCDRCRLGFLEDDSREYRKRISELEIEVMLLKRSEANNAKQ